MTDRRIEAATIGEAWLAVARAVLGSGAASTYDRLPILELDLVTVTVTRPASADPLIDRLGDPERLAWMRTNFTDHALVADLGGARSYAGRLYDYAGSGRDQIAWVVDRLRADPTSRSATITTFEPLLDTGYIPCVSLLDFWIRDGAVEQVGYAHSIDFGAKGYGNLVQLAVLQERVAAALDRPIGALVLVVKSAHVYRTELAYVRGALAGEAT